MLHSSKVHDSENNCKHDVTASAQSGGASDVVVKNETVVFENRGDSVLRFSVWPDDDGCGEVPSEVTA